MPSTRPVLLTGAAGYIASHTWLALEAAGYTVVGVDNFCNSSPNVLARLTPLLGHAPTFEEADVTDRAAMERVMERHRPSAVIHFAALKAVGESTSMPLRYFQNNLMGLVSVSQAMQAHGCRRMVFSSSATVYGDPQSLPIREEFPLSATNPYGQTKLMSEHILADWARAWPELRVACLRYFNPVGAHESGTIGEDPRGIPNNLMPFVAQVAVGKRSELQVFGGDYATPDGTGVRDYIHVVDLAEGHVAALRYLEQRDESITVNLGTGRGYSVLEVIKAYERASGRPVAYRIVDRRPGDIAACYADCGLAREKLGWSASRDIDAMCTDSWRWQHRNPDGFGA